MVARIILGVIVWVLGMWVTVMVMAWRRPKWDGDDRVIFSAFWPVTVPGLWFRLATLHFIRLGKEMHENDVGDRPNDD